MTFKLFLCLIAVGVVASEDSSPTVRIPNGVIQGAWKISTKGRSYASFEGIPYARPPIGKYRFREPQQLKPWTGVWDATRPLSICLQYDPLIKQIIGSENCLFLNVHTPRLQPGAKLPVLVFIHGGVFMYGAGSLYDAPNFMDRDMVIVTINYRLGPLGFLSTGDDVIAGNYGLKDQSFALHWVQNNIMMFGGDPDSVTLTGCSAGGASVHYHYLSPLSRGTFARGIAFSGAALSSWTHAIKPAEKARTLAATAGCPTGTSKEILDCLKYRPAEVVVRAQADMFDWKVHLFGIFTPVAEAPGVKQPFLQQYPYHATTSGQMMNVPLIASVTSEEGLYPAAAYQTDSSILPDLEANWEALASNIFEFNDTLPFKRHSEVAKAIKQYYLGGRPVSQETYPQLVQALSDRLFVADVGKLAQLHADYSGQPTYSYKYSYRGTYSWSTLVIGDNTNYGVSHADDVISLFKFPGTEPPSVEHSAMIDNLIEMVYSYATTGVPKFSQNGPEWLPVTPKAPELNYLEILSPNQSEMKSSSDFGHKSFWDSFGFNEGENYRVYLKDEL